MGPRLEVLECAKYIDWSQPSMKKTKAKSIGTQALSSVVAEINHSDGFTITELIITIVIIGILSSIALPNYFKNFQKARQNEATTIVTQLQNAIVSYVDENGIHPKGWKNINEVSAIMTPSGPANTQESFTWLTLANSNCREANGKANQNCYKVRAEQQNNLYTIEAVATDSRSLNYNIVACMDLQTGASDLKKGNSKTAASIGTLTCLRSEQ